MRGGQVSIEYIMIFGFIILLTVPLFYVGLSRSKENIRYEQASDAVNSVIKTADEVYALGQGSKDFVWISTPSGITSAYVDEKTFVIEISIFGGNSEYIAVSKANLTATQDFLDKIVLPGRYKVKVETYLNSSSGMLEILLGGYCGDGICSSSENMDICSNDCADYCGDGVCNYPATEGCGVNEETPAFCSDCIGSQADCADGSICNEDPSNPGTGICVVTPTCGNGLCEGEPYVENCGDKCPQDCQPGSDEECCYDAVLGIWYRANVCGIPPTVTSCPDWCVYIANRQGEDYNSGVCAQNEGKCDDFTGTGEWINIDELDIDGDTVGHPACDGAPTNFDNECDGDEFCQAGSQANYCCCILT